jgi:hypothetical protein
MHENCKANRNLGVQPDLSLHCPSATKVWQALAQATTPPSNALRLAAAEEGVLLRAGYANINELSASLLKFAAEHGCK